MLSPRNRELLGLLPAGLLVTAGFTAIFIQAEKSTPGSSTNLTLNHASSLSLTYGAIFLGAVPGGAPRDPLRAAQRGPLPVPARRRCWRAWAS